MKDKNLNHIKSSGFKVPDQYFQSLDDVILSNVSEDNISGKFSSSGFEVPEGYFESLDSKILSSIEDKDHSKVISIFSWKKAAYISGIAASLIIAFNLFFNNSINVSFDTLETASIQNYLINEDLNAYDLAPYLSTNELESDSFVDNKMNTSDIEEYLLQNSDVEHLILD